MYTFIIYVCCTYSINDSTDPFERMLAVLRFAFSKDLKFVVRPSVQLTLPTNL